MAGSKTEICELSEDELLAELRANGLKTGPITQTTRRIFEKRLARARGLRQNVDIGEICVISPNASCNLSPQHSNDTTEFCPSDNRVKLSVNGDRDFHYGVCFDRHSVDGSLHSLPTVFTNQHEALQAVKKLKGARFKPFKTRQEAEQFSLSFCSIPVNSPATKVTDPASSFKGPKQQELVIFRKAIEKGQSQEFIEFVNKNPKYLISCGDTPVILQEGSRYNAMHIAAKENKPHICKLIVETLESDSFWQNYLSLPNDSASQMNHTTKHILVDLYLNTPDKVNFETPLHFACKFGNIDVVEYLVSHPLTNTNPINKYGDTPEQDACSRCSSQTSVVKVKEKIKHLLEDNFYVPVFGSDGDATPPRIGEPWSPDIHKREGRTAALSSTSTHSPVEPRVTIRAYAGPMSPLQAAEFHHQWKTPPSTPEDKKKYRDIKRRDSTRGVERIGRSLAHTQGIPWAEYWSFLDNFVDFAKPSGLKHLEDFFTRRLIETGSENPFRSTPIKQGRSDSFSTPVSGRSEIPSGFLGENEDIRQDMMLERVGIGNGNVSPTFQEDQTLEEFQTQKSCLDVKSLTPLKLNVEQDNQSKMKHPSSSLMFDFNSLSLGSVDEKYINTELLDKPCSLLEISDKNTSTSDLDKDGDLLLCKKTLLGEFNESVTNENHENGELDRENNKLENERDVESSIQPIGSSNWTHEPPDLLLDENLRSSFEKLHINSNNEHMLVTDYSSCDGSPGTEKGRVHNENLSSILTHSKEIVHESLDSEKTREVVDCKTNKKKGMMLFMDGTYPSKLDLDVLRALDGVTIPPERYPLVTRWHGNVLSYTSRVRESWPSPGSPLFKKRYKSMLT